MRIYFKPVKIGKVKIEVTPMFQRLMKITVLCWLGLLFAALAWAEESNAAEWPQEIQTKQGTVVIYQPQAESLKDNQLKD